MHLRGATAHRGARVRYARGRCSDAVPAAPAGAAPAAPAAPAATPATEAPAAKDPKKK